MSVENTKQINKSEPSFNKVVLRHKTACMASQVKSDEQSFKYDRIAQNMVQTFLPLAVCTPSFNLKVLYTGEKKERNTF